MAGEFYVEIPPGDDLNQGDIIDNIPWGLIVAPTTVCRPDNRKAVTGKAVSYADANQASKPAAWELKPEVIHAIANCGLGVVVWHGCQIDKWKHKKAGRDRSDKAFVGIAPVIPISELPSGHRQDVLDGHSHAMFPLPGFSVGERAIPDSYVDLRHIWPLKQSIATDRLVMLSDLARESMYLHLFTFLTRATFEAPTCPRCGTAVALRLTGDDPDEPEGQTQNKV